VLAPTAGFFRPDHDPPASFPAVQSLVA